MDDIGAWEVTAQIMAERNGHVLASWCPDYDEPALVATASCTRCPCSVTVVMWGPEESRIDGPALRFSCAGT